MVIFHDVRVKRGTRRRVVFRSRVRVLTDTTRVYTQMQLVREKQCTCYSLHCHYTLLRAKVRLHNMYLVFSITCPSERVLGRHRLVLFSNVLDIQS